MGGFGFSILVSTIILSMNFFKKRGTGFKVLASILWPLTFGICVWVGMLAYIPYQIYNIVKIVHLTREEQQENTKYGV